jgi:hypothetical protein
MAKENAMTITKLLMIGSLATLPRPGVAQL